MSENQTPPEDVPKNEHLPDATGEPSDSPAGDDPNAEVEANLFLDDADEDVQEFQAPDQAPESDCASADEELEAALSEKAAAWAEVEQLRDALEALAAERDALAVERDALLGEREQVVAEREDYKNRALRIAADLENFRRRTQREADDLRKYGLDKIAHELIAVVDNMERALQHASASGETSNFVDGVRMVCKQLVNGLEKHGIKSFISKGEVFDPQRHEAIQQVESTELPTNTIVEEYQKGYHLHDRLIRPAMVSVSRYVGPPAAAEEPVDGEDAALEDGPEATAHANGHDPDGGTPEPAHSPDDAPGEPNA